jgi:hypothetical protein
LETWDCLTESVTKNNFGTLCFPPLALVGKPGNCRENDAHVTVLLPCNAFSGMLAKTWHIEQRGPE